MAVMFLDRAESVSVNQTDELARGVTVQSSALIPPSTPPLLSFSLFISPSILDHLRTTTAPVNTSACIPLSLLAVD